MVFAFLDREWLAKTLALEKAPDRAILNPWLPTLRCCGGGAVGVEMKGSPMRMLQTLLAVGLLPMF